MPIGELAMHYALQNHILQLQYKNRPKNQTIRPKLYR